jgi:mRNA interferase MazF
MARLIRRGDIRWYRFAQPDKRRPVLILTRDSALEFLSDVTVAPVTTTVRDIPSEVALTPADGVPHACAVNLDHIQTVSKARLGALIATLPDDRWPEVRAAALFGLGFSDGRGAMIPA